MVNFDCAVSLSTDLFVCLVVLRTCNMFGNSVNWTADQKLE